MIAHVAFVDCTPQQAVEAARRIAEEVWPVLRRTEGFRSSVFLVDRARDQAMTVTLWENDEARATADASGPPDRRRVFEEIGVRRREAQIFEVLRLEGALV